MNRSELDTIVALATPPGYGGVGVIRVSGPQVKEISTKILNQVPKPRYALVSNFYADNGEIIDQGVALYFPRPNSFTGEEVLELQGHGGPVVMDRLVQQILQQGARMANPGEFSERAFLNGKLDLAQAEAIADLINASSTQAARAALLSLQGEFSRKIKKITEKLLALRVKIEAAIDFTEEDIEFVTPQERETELTTLLQQLRNIQDSAEQGVLLREGVRVAIVGAPNVGKSSLLNYFTGRDAAIVTNIPGTTRDVLREFINLDGLPLHFIDTAGLRESVEPIEREGIKRTWAEIKNADFVLVMTDSEEVELEPYQEFRSKLIIVRNKIDLTAVSNGREESGPPPKIFISVKTGAGIALLRQQLQQRAAFKGKEGVFSARRRHLEAIQRAEGLLMAARQHAAEELVAEELRLAQNALGEISGEIYNEELLDRVFAEFCVGK